MTRIVQARLDEKTDSLLEQLQKQLGCSNSEIVRQGIQMLAAVTPKKGKRQFRGMGKYDSGTPDLASNKKHLERRFLRRAF